MNGSPETEIFDETTVPVSDRLNQNRFRLDLNGFTG